jgi:nucleotide-binding universal stress UspA family protein
MSIRTILVPVFAAVSETAQLAAALAVARRIGGHIEAVFIRPRPDTLFNEFPESALISQLGRDELSREEEATEAAARARFDAWHQDHELATGRFQTEEPRIVANWSGRLGSVERMIVQCARLSDLVVLNFPTGRLLAAGQAFDAAVFDGGRPVLLVPPVARADMFAHVVIAWSGSLEATRAVAASMPLLCAADRVSVFCAPQSSEPFLGADDLIEALSWHGVGASALPEPNIGGRVGDELLRMADEVGATLLVMGAYTHSRMRQLFLGGVTDAIVRAAARPTFLMH